MTGQKITPTQVAALRSNLEAAGQRVESLAEILATLTGLVANPDLEVEAERQPGDSESELDFAKEFAKLCQAHGIAAAYVEVVPEPVIQTLDRPSGPQVKIGGHRTVCEMVTATFQQANQYAPSVPSIPPGALQ